MNFIFKGVKYCIYFVLMFIFSCSYKDSKLNNVDFRNRDLAQILADGKLIAVTDYTSANYFIYKGEPMGFQYEMLVSLASNLGVKLELIAENDPVKALNMLKDGEVDIIANDLSYISSKKEQYKSTVPYRQYNLVLIQRKSYDEYGVANSTLIRNLKGLTDKKVYVATKSCAAKVLKDLAQEEKISIKIEESSTDDAEQMIDLVATGSVDYVVCDFAIAKVQSTIYSNIDIETKIGDEQDYKWAVGLGAHDLLNKVNDWMLFFPKSLAYSNIYSKYFDNPYMAIIKKSDYFYSTKGRLSVFDEQIKSESNQINWDWRLVASLIYQESKFNPNVRSESGAYGLMQFMPNTAEFFGIEHEASPSVQLKTGIRYLKMLEKYMEEIKIPEKERLKFVLAAYNAGYGHILDARSLAKKYGKDPNVWDNNVAFFIQNKKEFCSDSVVRYGYLRGSETYNFVNEILDRYNHYKNIIKR